MYYSGTIIRAAGFAANTAVWLAAGVAFFNFAFTIVGMALVERAGRRRLTLLSLAGVVCALGYVGTVFYFRDLRSPSSLKYHRSGTAPLLGTPLLGASLHHCQQFDNCATCVVDSGCGFFGNSRQVRARRRRRPACPRPVGLR